MLRNGLKKGNTSGLVLAGLAAFAYYKYSKMSTEEKSNLSSMIMEKGKSLLSHFMPETEKTITASAPANNSF